MSQFNLPKSNKMMPPKKVAAVLDTQSDAAIGLPTKVKVPGNSLPKSGKGMKAMSMKMKMKG